MLKAGLPQCGMATARGLIRYGLGTSLCAAILTYEGTDLSNYLVKWRSRLISYVAEDPKGYIGRARPALARALPASFPDLDIVRLFTAPEVFGPNHYHGLRVPRRMDIAKLGALCERYFAFGNRASILRTFRTALWSNELIHMLISNALEGNVTRTPVIDHRPSHSLALIV